MDERDLYGARRSRGFGGLVLGLLLAFLLGAALTVVGLRHSSRFAALLHPNVPAAPAAMAAPVRPVAPSPLAVPAPVAADPALAARLDTVESRIATIEARAEAASGDADRAEGLLVTFAARRALDRGQPLGFLEGMLRERFGGSDAAAVALVIASAQRPVTLPQLEDGFLALQPALISPRSSESWWTGVKRELGSLFVVRKAETPSSVPDQRLARAAHALDQGQVDVAAAEVARLPGAPRANDWLAAARRYTLARNALDRLETAALLKPAATPASPLLTPANAAAPD